ncbi:MAG: hypothetical protein U0169_08565 [Polyangiaceae bacterium]
MKISNAILLAVSSLVFVGTTGCDVFSYSGGLERDKAEDDDANGEESNDDGDYGTESKRKASDAAKSCKQGVAHTGFGGSDLNAGRAVAEVGVDRRRVKPYGALATEFSRALGTAPAALAANAAAFGDAPARWYSEPRANAVSLYTNYSVAFTGCYDSMSGAQYAAAPTAESAKAECTTRTKTAWQRNASREELQSCIDFATTGSASTTDARRRWAHVCATILTSAAFTTY